MAVRSPQVRLSTLGVAVCASFLLAGCGALGTDACPAVGYMQSLTVHVEGSAQDVQEVLVCGGGECSDGTAPGTDLNTVSAQKSSDEVPAWAATLSYPEEPLLIQIIGSDGSILKEALVEPDWRLTGGSERCGGPSAAEVTLSL